MIRSLSSIRTHFRRSPSGRHRDERENERHRAVDAGDKAVVQIEGFCLLGNRVDEYTAYPENHCRLADPKNRILQQGDPEPPPLMVPVDRKTSQDRHRDWIRHVAPESTGRLGLGETAGSQRVVPDNIAGFRHDDVGARRAGDLIRACPAFEPVVERGHTGHKIVNDMGVRQRRWRTQAHSDQGRGADIRRS